MAENAPAAVMLPQVAAPPAPAPSVSPAGAVDGAQRHQIFAVELNPGDTTIVSWKKLLRKADRADSKVLEKPATVPPGPGKPAENDQMEPAPPSNRFSAVIEKIERLYMGKQSSDEEELDDVPDDDEYDTEDSFIDDTELDEYFEVDNLKTKYNGFFVNKGKLEEIEAGTSTDVAPKKRRRKDSTIINEKNKNLGSINHDHIGPAGPHKKKSDGVNLISDNTVNVKPIKEPSMGTEFKEFDVNRVGTSRPTEISHKLKGASGSYVYGYPAYQEKESFQIDFQSRKLLNGEGENVLTKVQQKEKRRSETGEFTDMSTSTSVYPTHALHPTPTRDKRNSSVKPKVSRLERAIRDLERIVAECRPPNHVVPEVDPAGQVVKRRLPQEVKQKLASVARLSASQGKVSEDVLIDRLMGIVGHLVQRKTLKRNLKEMVEVGIYHKQEMANRFQRIKNEIIEMVQTQVSAWKSKVGEQQVRSADDFVEAGGNNDSSLQGKFRMNAALEDKITDLYDVYVEGMDGDKGTQTRKLYVELAELWPPGCMDNLGIRDAISRSKDRKRALVQQYKVRDEERLKRKRMRAAPLGPAPLGAANHASQSQFANQSCAVSVVSSERLPISSQPLMPAMKAADTTIPVPSYAQYLPKASDKPSETSSSMLSNPAEAKKTKKKRLEQGTTEGHAHALAGQAAKLKSKPHKQNAEAAKVGGYCPQPVPPVLCLPSYDKANLG